MGRKDRLRKEARRDAERLWDVAVAAMSLSADGLIRWQGCGFLWGYEVTFGPTFAGRAAAAGYPFHGTFSIRWWWLECATGCTFDSRSAKDVALRLHSEHCPARGRATFGEAQREFRRLVDPHGYRTEWAKDGVRNVWEVSGFPARDTFVEMARDAAGEQRLLLPWGTL